MTLSGGHREDVTPVPIPNTEVKSLIGEGTARFAGGRVARCRVFPKPDLIRGQAFFVCLEPHLNTAGIRDAWRVGGFVQEGEECVPYQA